MRTHVIVGYAYAKRVEKEDRFHGFDTATINTKTYALVPEDAFTEQIHTVVEKVYTPGDTYLTLAGDQVFAHDGFRQGERYKRVIVKTDWEAVEA